LDFSFVFAPHFGIVVVSGLRAMFGLREKLAFFDVWAPFVIVGEL
jgi:hypothetical protein